MHAIDVTLAAATGLALVAGLFLHGLRRRWLNEPVLALLLGVAIGPVGLGWLDLAAYGEEPAILKAVARFTLAVAVVGVGLELRRSIARDWRSWALLVLAGAALMCATSALLAGWILGLGMLPALLIGAVLSPIDPILASTVATGKIARETLPERLRHLLTAESTARHGLGLFLVLLPALLLTKPPAEAWQEWVVRDLVWKGLVAVAIGAAVGFTAAQLQWRSAAGGEAEDRTGPLIALYLALALALVSGVELLASDAVLAVIVAGVTYAWARTNEPEEDADELAHQERLYQEVVKQVLEVPVFLLLGAALPWAEWGALGWNGVLLVVALLFLRRIPVVLLLKPLVGPIRRWDEALFVGWFGPVGVGGLYFAAVAREESGDERVWAVATLLIAVTVVVHDLTSTPLSYWLARRIGRSGCDSNAGSEG